MGLSGFTDQSLTHSEQNYIIVSSFFRKSTAWESQQYRMSL